MNGENHHIIPRSIRPDLAKDKTNIVRLTYREHYLAHWLLTKIYIEGKEHQSMVYAFYMFNSLNKRKRYMNSKAYEKNREEIHSLLTSRKFTNDSLKKMSMAQLEAQNRQKVIDKKSDSMKKWCSDNPEKVKEYAEKRNAIIKDLWNDEEWRNKTLEKLYARHPDTSDTSEKKSKASKAKWDDPKWHDMMLKIHQERGDFERFASYADNCKGKIWWRKDGEKDKRSFESPGPGWQPGRTYHRK